jgi:hypothetical protein
MLSAKFTEIIDNQMLVPKLQQTYDNTPSNTIELNGLVDSATYTAQIGALLNEKDQTLRYFAQMAGQPTHSKDISFDEYILSVEKAFIKDLSDQGDEQIIRAYFTAHKDGNTILHSVPGRTDPAEKAPPSASTKEYTPIYPPSGDSNIDGEADWINTETYDPRRTDWYSNAIAGPKDIFIIVDETNLVSSTTTSSVSWNALKQTLLHILSTISPNDNVWMQRRSIFGKTANQSAPLLAPFGTAGCMEKHARGTKATVKQLLNAVKGMTQPPELVSASASASSSSSASTPEDWINMLTSVFDVISTVRSQVQSQRAGVVLILSSGDAENNHFRTVLEPFVLKHNVHQFPIVEYYFSKSFQTSSTPSGSGLPTDLVFKCTDFGIAAWVTNTVQAMDAALYYENIIKKPHISDPFAVSVTSVSCCSCCRELL